MVVANIFGINCKDISNVQFAGLLDQIGRFEKGVNIGLNSGLVMSTGDVNSLNQPSSTFNSINFNTQGDLDINNAFSTLGTNVISFDASTITFDFLPRTKDTINFKYVFASEEYPEYANSYFNDRFLFLVSSDNGPYTNIAFIPGTSIPVEINSINQNQNNQFYTDNQVGANSIDFVFDGYTTPLTAQFIVEAGTIYHVKLVIADLNDGIYDSAIFLEEQETYSDLTGNLLVNNLPAVGSLDVYNYTGDTALVQPFLTLNISNGTYFIDSLKTGIFYFKFTPDTSLFQNVAPLYFSSGNTWSTASKIGLPCFTDGVNINSNSINIINGYGSITGSIIIDSTYLKSKQIPLKNALLKLLNLENQLIDFTYTNNKGEYLFSKIPVGIYQIYIDIPFIPQINLHTITIIGSEIIDGVDFSISNEGILAINNTDQPFKKNEIIVCPNPVSDFLKISNGFNDILYYSIISIEGKIVENGSLSLGTYQIDVKNYKDGIYFLSFGENETRKIIIKK
ncbi:MAG: hypothetical protein RIT10_658 [Bacteroidota bacterium]